jgi:hypothetical protein
MEFIKAFLATVGVILAVTALGIGGRYVALHSDAYFAPREEQVRHNTFECSQSHTDGLTHEILDYRDQYGKADAAGKEVIRERVLGDFNSYTCGDLPQSVQTFVNSIR